MMDAMRAKLVVGNWKMNLTRPEAASCVESLVRQIEHSDSVEVGVCPSYLSIPVVASLLQGKKIFLGAQDVFWAESGAFTGRVSPGMLKEAGVQLCVVGHSEPRGRFGKLDVPESTVGFFAETDETVNLKTKALLYHGITPVLCVGETLSEREAGQTDEVIQKQLDGGLAGIDASEFETGVVAYEPVWAIGTGKTCDTAEASRVCGMIRTHLAKLFGAETADQIRVLYGGSVKGSNAKELFHAPDIDGGLVGGASLKPEEFLEVVRGAR
jgi:triosephosphate isomerase